MPLPAARRRDPTSIKRLCDVPESVRSRLLSLADDRKHVSGIPICFGLYRPYGTPARLGEPRIAKGHAASLRSRKGLTGPRGDEGALLLCQCGYRQFRLSAEAHQNRNLRPRTTKWSVALHQFRTAHDRLRGAREKNLTFSRNDTGAAMYPAFECSRCGRWP